MRGLRYSMCILLMFLMSGCILFIRRDFSSRDHTIRFSKDYDPMVGDRLNLDGYFYDDRPYSVGVFSLYPDGTYMGFSFLKGYDLMGKSVTNLDSLIRIEKGRKLSYYGGIYKVVGDTVIIEGFWDDLVNTWSIGISKYIIENKNTIRLFEGVSVSKCARERSVRKHDILYYFVKASPLPSSFEAKVKTKKWMWENKEDWRAYMIEVDKYLDSKGACDSVN